MYRILIVDDHPVVRHGVRHILESVPGFAAIEEAGGAYEALDKIRAGELDLVLLDIALPDMNGIETLREIKRVKSGLPVLMLSVYEEELYAVRAMKEGAAGYLTKGSVSAELTEAVEKVCNGGVYITATLAVKLAAAVSAGVEGDLHSRLSLREFEVLRLLGQGKSVKTVSEQLRLSPKTITTYRARILEKMKFTSNEDIVQYTLQNRLVD
jgi:two-component system, NarL family, invasion response regulator UvrY